MERLTRKIDARLIQWATTPERMPLLKRWIMEHIIGAQKSQNTKLTRIQV